MEGLHELSTLADLRGLGDYCDFDFEKEVKGDFTRIYAVVKLGRSKLFWLVKPVGGLRRIDVDALSFYIMAREGVVGLLYKSRVSDKKYRIVFFYKPLKRLPRQRRKAKRRMHTGE
jgi:hypothetical protein